MTDIDDPLEAAKPGCLLFDAVWKIMVFSVIGAVLLTVSVLIILGYRSLIVLGLAISGIVSLLISYLASRSAVQRRKLIEEQNRALTRLNEDIRQANTDLEARNAELAMFSYTVAHDLQTPLGTIIGYCDIGTALIETHTKSDLAQLLQRIMDIAQNSSHIIDSLLLLASVREEQVTFEPLDMQPIVERAWRRLDSLIREYDASITYPDTWPVARGHDRWVEGIWSNYLSNAIKYGGRPPLIEIGADLQDDDLIRFWVRDNGRGISLEEQEKLFTPFGQLQPKGHGLGLSIVYRIGERLGGSVGVDSEIDQGSTFYFTLPAGKAKWS